MINLYGTVIDENVIIGVGPLMVKRPGDPVAGTINKERAYYFQVYTHNYHFAISTEWLSFNEENAEVSKKEHAAILGDYKALKECLISGVFTGMRMPQDND
jgi:hypothetical protein